MTFPADEGDDKSIYNHRENAEEPAENPKPRFHRISSEWLSRTFQLFSSVKPRVFSKVLMMKNCVYIYIFIQPSGPIQPT